MIIVVVRRGLVFRNGGFVIHLVQIALGRGENRVHLLQGPGGCFQGGGQVLHSAYHILEGGLLLVGVFQQVFQPGQRLVQMLARREPFVDGGLQRFAGLLQLFGGLFAQLFHALGVVQQGAGIFGNGLQLVHHLAGVLQQGRHVPQRVRHAGREIVDAAAGLIGPFHQTVRQRLHAVFGGLGGAGQAGKLAGNCAAAAAGVVHGAVHQPFQLIQLVVQGVQLAGIVFQGHFRFQLAAHAAHIPAALHRTAVVTAPHKTAGAPAHAAHVVAHGLKAHGPLVGTALHNAGRKPRHAADVGGYGDILGGVQPVHIQVVQAQRGFDLLHVHRAPVGALAYHAQILAHHAAHHPLGLQAAQIGAALHGAGGLVAAHQSAHLVFSLDHAGKAAVVDQPPVYGGDAAQKIAPVGRLQLAFHPQVAHGGALLHIAEQALPVAAFGQLQAGDGVPLAVEVAAEHRNAGKAAAFQVNVRLQQHGHAAAGAVQHKQPLQLHQVGGGAHGVHGGAAAFLGRRITAGRRGNPVRCVGQYGQRAVQGQRGAQGQRGRLFGKCRDICVTFHLSSPAAFLRPPVGRRSPVHRSPAARPRRAAALLRCRWPPECWSRRRWCRGRCRPQSR